MGIARILRLAGIALMAMQMPAAAGPPDSALPRLSPAEMNCADTARTDDSGLDKLAAHEIGLSLDEAYDAGKVTFAQKEWPVRPNHIAGTYVLAFCGVSRNGQRYIIVDGIYEFLGNLVCDDAAGFGVVYDPRSRQFGDITFGVSSCVPQKPKQQ